MAEALNLSRSGYYAARKRLTSCRERENLFLVEEIRTFHKSTRRVYGSPRMTAELNARGFSCSEKRLVISRDGERPSLQESSWLVNARKS